VRSNGQTLQAALGRRLFVCKSRLISRHIYLKSLLSAIRITKLTDKSRDKVNRLCGSTFCFSSFTRPCQLQLVNERIKERVRKRFVTERHIMCVCLSDFFNRTFLT
jgi:hypothetical protein